MAHTYTQIHIQVVFAVKRRENIMLLPWREEVYKYMAGIIREKKNKPIIINGTSDHVHLFIGLHPANSISELVRDIKSGSTNFIHTQNFVRGCFSWQEGYGAFSYAHSQVENVYQYILRQNEHHKGKTFREEYLEILKKFDVGYDDQYLFDWLQ